MIKEQEIKQKLVDFVKENYNNPSSDEIISIFASFFLSYANKSTNSDRQLMLSYINQIHASMLLGYYSMEEDKS